MKKKKKNMNKKFIIYKYILQNNISKRNKK